MTSNETIEMTKRAVLSFAARPIAYYPVFARIAGTVKAGIFLSQLFYWSGKGSNADGWIYKTQAEWKEETELSAYEQKTARETLKGLGLIEEKLKGIPAQLYYRLNLDHLIETLTNVSPVCEKLANKDESNLQAIPETTTENTFKTLPSNEGSIRINADTNEISFPDPVPEEENTEYIPCDEDGDMAEAKPVKKQRKPQAWRIRALADAAIFVEASQVPMPPDPNGSKKEYAAQNVHWLTPLKHIRYVAEHDEIMRQCVAGAVEELRENGYNCSCPRSIESTAISIAGNLRAKAKLQEPEKHSWSSSLTGEWYDAETDTHHPGPGQIGYNADAGT